MRSEYIVVVAAATGGAIAGAIVVGAATGAATGGAIVVGAATGAATGAAIVVGAATGAAIVVGAATGAAIVVGAATGASIVVGAATGASIAGAIVVGAATGASIAGAIVVGAATGAAIVVGGAIAGAIVVGAATGGAIVVGAATGGAIAGAIVVGAATGAAIVVGAIAGAIVVGAATGAAIAGAIVVGAAVIVGRAVVVGRIAARRIAPPLVFFLLLFLGLFDVLYGKNPPLYDGKLIPSKEFASSLISDKLFISILDTLFIISNALSFCNPGIIRDIIDIIEFLYASCDILSLGNRVNALFPTTSGCKSQIRIPTPFNPSGATCVSISFFSRSPIISFSFVCNKSRVLLYDSFKESLSIVNPFNLLYILRNST
jgi:hypothetical protein